VNGNRVNATIYYVLSQSPSLVLSTTSESKRAELNVSTVFSLSIKKVRLP
jgi:hypothetical protein